MPRKKWTSPAAERMHQLLQDDVDIATRSIYFWDDVYDYSICDVVKKIKYFESLSTADPIILYINTHGGMETEMFALYDTIRCSPCEIITIGIGKVMSAGPLILASGDKRFIYPSTQIMIHEGWADWGSGGVRDVQVEVDWCKNMNETWCEYMGLRTKQNKEWWFAITDHEPDLYFTAQRAVELGIVDEVIDELS